jgi:hypothetical protein
MLCKIINPSDAYTLRTDDFTLAGVATAILGDGKLGLSCGELRTPILFGWPEWLKANSVENMDAYISANYAKLADVLDTVMIGDANTRATIEGALARMPADQHEAYLAETHERLRTSMNDIGRHAKYLTTQLRELAAKQQEAASG